jgi:hypothetical protein
MPVAGHPLGGAAPPPPPVAFSKPALGSPSLASKSLSLPAGGTRILTIKPSATGRRRLRGRSRARIKLTAAPPLGTIAKTYTKHFTVVRRYVGRPAPGGTRPARFGPPGSRDACSAGRCSGGRIRFFGRKAGSRAQLRYCGVDRQSAARA